MHSLKFFRVKTVYAIFQLANHRVEKVEDVVKEGDWLKVKVMEVDKKTGKISLSHKDAIEEGEE